MIGDDGKSLLILFVTNEVPRLEWLCYRGLYRKSREAAPFIDQKIRYMYIDRSTHHILNKESRCRL